MKIAVLSDTHGRNETVRRPALWIAAVLRGLLGGSAKAQITYPFIALGTAGALGPNHVAAPVGLTMDKAKT